MITHHPPAGQDAQLDRAAAIRAAAALLAPYTRHGQYAATRDDLDVAILARLITDRRAEQGLTRGAA